MIGKYEELSQLLLLFPLQLRQFEVGIGLRWSEEVISLNGADEMGMEAVLTSMAASVRHCPTPWERVVDRNCSCLLR